MTTKTTAPKTSKNKAPKAKVAKPKVAKPSKSKTPKTKDVSDAATKALKKKKKAKKKDFKEMTQLYGSRINSLVKDAAKDGLKVTGKTIRKASHLARVDNANMATQLEKSLLTSDNATVTSLDNRFDVEATVVDGNILLKSTLDMNAFANIAGKDIESIRNK